MQRYTQKGETTMYNPYLPNYPARQEIVKVNGNNGAQAFQLPPNSSALALDENSPILYLITTDGAGYKSVTPYSIAPYVPEPAPDFKALEARLRRLEERYESGIAAAAAEKDKPADN